MINALVEMLQASNPLLIVIAGLMIGLVHAFEPDHISAVSTQVLKKDKDGDDKRSNNSDNNDNTNSLKKQN